MAYYILCSVEENPVGVKKAPVKLSIAKRRTKYNSRGCKPTEPVYTLFIQPEPRRGGILFVNYYLCLQSSMVSHSMQCAEAFTTKLHWRSWEASPPTIAHYFMAPNNCPMVVRVAAVEAILLLFTPFKPVLLSNILVSVVAVVALMIPLPPVTKPVANDFL